MESTKLQQTGWGHTEPDYAFTGTHWQRIPVSAFTQQED